MLSVYIYINRIINTYLIPTMVKKKDIIAYFMRTTKGIKGTAGYFGISKAYVGKVITVYKKKHRIR